MRANFSVTLLSLLVATMLSCGTSAGSGSDGSDAADASGFPDAIGDDGGAVDAITPDTDADDADTDTDTDTDTDELGVAGDPCRDDRECESRVCIDVVPGEDLDGLCSSHCTTDADCPRDFDCVFLVGAGDTQRICLPVDLCIDLDDDGWGVGPGCAGSDCDDEQPLAHAGRDEVCDGIDNDCDGVTDDNPIDANVDCETGFPGQCQLGRTTCDGGLIDCVQRTGPTAETCDRIDNDCDGQIDEDAEGMPLSRQCYDGDIAVIGTGVCAWGQQTCQDGGFSGCIGQRLPSAEVCDGIDNDCDGTADDGLATRQYFVDADLDGFGDASADPVSACAQPEGYVENSSDCNDDDRLVRPGVAEIPGDGVDQNCDGSEFCYEDVDGDGYRPASSTTVVSLDDDCDDPGEARATQPSGDCDDDEARAFPGNPEVCDAIDNNCNRRVDEGAGCYPNGTACVDPADCASGLCEDRICVRPLNCVDLGTCPDRVTATAGGARLSTDRFTLQISSGTGTNSPVLRSSRYRITVGSGPYVTDP